MQILTTATQSSIAHLSILYLRCQWQCPRSVLSPRCILSILYLRCAAGAVAGATFGAVELSILYLRCRRGWPPESGGMREYLSILYLRCQVPRLERHNYCEVPFNSLFEMPHSRGIKYGPGLVRISFNSLFEMRVARFQGPPPKRRHLSILYLRCRRY